MDKSLSKPFTMCALIYWERHEERGKQSKPENTLSPQSCSDHTIVFKVSQRPAVSPVGLLPPGEQGEQHPGTLMGPFQ